MVIKVAFLHRSNTGVAAYRLWQPGRHLKRLDGWDCKRLPGPHTMDKLTLAQLGETATWADILVFERPHTKEEVSALLAARDCCKVKLVMDIDDDIYHVHEAHQAYEAYKHREDSERYNVQTTKDEVYASHLSDNGWWVKFNDGEYVCVQEKYTDYCGNFDAIACEVDAITTTTQTLKELYSEVNENIFVLPNYIDFEVWDGLERGKNKKMTIGWAGASSHRADLGMIEEPMLAVLEKHPNAVFSLMGIDCPFESPNGQIIGGHSRWVPIQEYPQAVALLGFDIGIAPLEDNAFNRAKSNLRWLEYSVLGIPSVCSSLPEFTDSVRDMDTGLLAKTNEGWKLHINALVEDKELREKMGKAAHEDVRERFNMERNVGMWADVYRGVME